MRVSVCAVGLGGTEARPWRGTIFTRAGDLVSATCYVRFGGPCSMSLGVMTSGDLNMKQLMS